MPIGILYVCTANICRSPMAEGVFRTMARRAGLASAFSVDLPEHSMGTSASRRHGPPSRRQRVAAMTFAVCGRAK